jgi:hypothetical protein
MINRAGSRHVRATNSPELPLPYGRDGSSRWRASISGIPSRLRVFLARQAWGGECLRELRSFLRCSRTLLSLKTIPLVDLGPESGTDQVSGHLIECSHTRGRRIDMQRFHAEHPGATLSQTILYLEGWNRGAEWAASNPDSCRPHSDHLSHTTRRWTGCFLPK